MLIDTVLNDSESGYGDTLNSKRIHEIDDGDYQGTLLYLIPFDTYQPGEEQYLMTSVYYGSCSGCDTWQAIESMGDWESEKLTDRQVTDLMALAKDMLVSMIKPYPSRWREDDKFTTVEESFE